MHWDIKQNAFKSTLENLNFYGSLGRPREVWIKIYAESCSFEPNWNLFWLSLEQARGGVLLLLETSTTWAKIRFAAEPLANREETQTTQKSIKRANQTADFNNNNLAS